MRYAALCRNAIGQRVQTYLVKSMDRLVITVKCTWDEYFPSQKEGSPNFVVTSETSPVAIFLFPVTAATALATTVVAAGRCARVIHETVLNGTAPKFRRAIFPSVPPSRPPLLNGTPGREERGSTDQCGDIQVTAGQSHRLAMTCSSTE